MAAIITPISSTLLTLVSRDNIIIEDLDSTPLEVLTVPALTNIALTSIFVSEPKGETNEDDKITITSNGNQPTLTFQGGLTNFTDPGLIYEAGDVLTLTSLQGSKRVDVVLAGVSYQA